MFSYNCLIFYCGINIKTSKSHSHTIGNRSRTEIAGSILDVANWGTTNKNMYKALSYNQVKEYLSVLIENNLIEYLDGSQTFKTTEKGLNYLKCITKLENYY
jgi:predicted transcriptional regulator